MGKKLTDRICMNVVRTVFGDDPDVLLDDFFGGTLPLCQTANS